MSNKIIFLGQDHSLHPEYLGGTHSIIRRFAEYAGDNGIDLELVSFGSNTAEQLEIFSIKFTRHKSFSDALKHIIFLNPKHVVSFYIPRWNRLTYLFFRLFFQKILFSKILFEFCDSPIKARFANFDAHLFNYSHKIFCISPRIQNREKYFQNTKRIYPPLPKNWPNTRGVRCSGKTQIAFLGRFCSGKGYDLLPDLFNEIESLATNVEFLVSGYGEQTNQYYSENVVERIVDQQLWDVSVDEKLLEMYSKTDILLLPYRTLETTIDCPLVVVEAVANSCLVICTATELMKLNSSSILCTKYEDMSSTVSSIINKGRDRLTDVLDPNFIQKYNFQNAGRNFFESLI